MMLPTLRIRIGISIKIFQMPHSMGKAKFVGLNRGKVVARGRLSLVVHSYIRHLLINQLTFMARRMES